MTCSDAADAAGMHKPIKALRHVIGAALRSYLQKRGYAFEFDLKRKRPVE